MSPGSKRSRSKDISEKTGPREAESDSTSRYDRIDGVQDKKTNLLLEHHSHSYSQFVTFLQPHRVYVGLHVIMRVPELLQIQSTVIIQIPP